MHAGDKYTFTTEEGANGTNNRISVNYDGFVNDVSVGDILLIDGGINSLRILSVEGRDVVTEVVDGGTMKSRYQPAWSLSSPCPFTSVLTIGGQYFMHAIQA